MESKTIPDEHRWVKMCKANFSTHNISPVTHIVKYVYPKNNVGTQPIGDQIGVVSHYSRFTNFWISTPYYYDTEKKNTRQQRRVIGETNSIIHNPLMFQTYYPIYKPWAETHLIMFCGETDGPFSDKTYKKIEDVLEMNYEKKYVKRWFVDVENASNQSFATAKHYAKTVSPFRNEIYLTHGARDEYDENLFVSEG